MKSFLTILKFELGNFFKNKTFIISTLLLAIVGTGVMFYPRIKQAFKSNSSSNKEASTKPGENKENKDDDDLRKVGIVASEEMKDMDLLAEIFPDWKFIEYDDVDTLKAEIEKNDEDICDTGFAITSFDEYSYYVYNNSVFGDDTSKFSEYMKALNEKVFCKNNKIDYDDFKAVKNKEIKVESNILGKDGAANYWYCYALVILVFMFIIMYGIQVANSVANEKSNRSIEVLVTSAPSGAIFCGKVFACVISNMFQVGMIGLGTIGGYKFNKEYWNNNIMNMLFDIPGKVIVTFVIFGLGGFILYMFIYGVFGALVSKAEDINKSASTVQMVIMIVYIATLFSLFNVDGIVMKVFSFLPISSYSAMFARVAMGSVALWEVIVSAILTYVTVVIVGIIGGKIFRNSTLRYGNPIKITNALKALKKNKA